MREALAALVAALDRCESNRGRFSCTDEHDCRCATKWKRPGPCDCGSAELEHALKVARELLDPPRCVTEPLEAIECPGPDCPMCSGACCNLCGAGLGSATVKCDHSTDQRHDGA